MRTELATTLLVIALAFALGACAPYQEPKVVENILPANYRPKLIDILRERLDDPTNIRDAFITEPALTPYGGVSRYVVCLRFNPRDRNGRYEGNKEYAAFYFAGELTQLVDGNRELCGKAAYQPFPELQKLCKTIVCKS